MIHISFSIVNSTQKRNEYFFKLNSPNREEFGEEDEEDEKNQYFESLEMFPSLIFYSVSMVMKMKNIKVFLSQFRTHTKKE